ncbi:MAG TPA: GNAT family N-acetyltransferase [Thermoanaerobaculia bacterium]|jgi:CelD/BcsL family acetyltransferase involved in cellulose biosynthesis
MRKTALAITRRSLEDFRIDVVDDASAFAELRDEWNELLASSRSDCLFLTWEWLHTWWVHLGQGKRLFIVTVRDGSGLVALAPLTMTRSWIGPIGVPVLELAGTGSIGSDYLDFIADSARETTALEALATFLAETGLSLRLSSVKEDSLIATAVGQILRDRGWQSRQTMMQACPFVDLAIGSWDSYLDGLHRKHRSNFTRTRRNLNRDYTVGLEFADSDEKRHRALTQLIELHLTRRDKLGGSNAFHTPRLLEFHETLSRLALARGWLRLLVLTLNGTVAAALYCFRYGRTFVYYQSGFDPAFHTYGLGQLMVGLTIRQAFEEGAPEYDFLHGGEPYKFNWTTQTRRLVRLEFYPPSRIGRMHHVAAQTVDVTKTLIKRVLSRTSN